MQVCICILSHHKLIIEQNKIQITITKRENQKKIKMNSKLKQNWPGKKSSISQKAIN